MKRLRRIVLALAMFMLVVSIILLMNITAPNPTHRRYSSETPLTTRQGDGQAIGNDAERIIAYDLRLTNNNDSAERQCLCKDAVISSNRKSCNVCFPIPDLQSDYRVPDFIAPGFIAESKNARNLLYTGREFDQISDYARAAKLLNRPLWVYVRVNTNVDADFYQIVESTGGAVVPYFTVPGYVDSVDDTAWKSGAASGLLLVGAVWLEWRSFRKRSFKLPVPRMPQPRQPADPVNGLARKITHVEDFAANAKDRLRTKLDEEDEWNDL